MSHVRAACALMRSFRLSDFFNCTVHSRVARSQSQLYCNVALSARLPEPWSVIIRAHCASRATRDATFARRLPQTAIFPVIMSTKIFIAEICSVVLSSLGSRDIPVWHWKRLAPLRGPGFYTSTSQYKKLTRRWDSERELS